MPHEIIGELIVGGVELGAEMAAGGDNNKNPLRGCLIMIILIGILSFGVYYYITNVPQRPQTTKGLVTKKLTDDRVLVKTKTDEDVYTITHELYLNKKVGDSIILNN